MNNHPYDPTPGLKCGVAADHPTIDGAGSCLLTLTEASPTPVNLSTYLLTRTDLSTKLHTFRTRSHTKICTFQHNRPNLSPTKQTNTVIMLIK